MIKILPNKKPTTPSSPYYRLTYNYMIGDANGDTTEESNCSVDNPYVERYVYLLNKLTPIKGHWGIVLEQDRLLKHFQEGQLTQGDYDFLKFAMFSDDSGSTFNPSEEDIENYLYDFCEGVQSITEYSFLVFQGITLEYVDGYGEVFQTEIIPD